MTATSKAGRLDSSILESGAVVAIGADATDWPIARCVAIAANAAANNTSLQWFSLLMSFRGNQTLLLLTEKEGSTFRA
jgi:hypothetical protein